ncbi:hydrogenase maturation protease [Legionella maioricensis]|uniref:Hydrogenase maturation protease n=1 Tax=Legionella maioricensis TaxID=2896528 RepID=A0A9X2ICX5_9GAMM|nr:hydrogenase maturation protease [Legionella maioricensis]MCL9684937.1 hydrogenase maturation protease [Legionella maioricensis]MCL9688231.1 hydrogenase maturation protease [Legionella maioricensis]
MNRIKVLGIGSPFGDDQAGWKVADALKQHLAMHPNITQWVSIESHDRPGARLIELMSGARTVFIIDAVKSGSEPGTVHRFKNDDIIKSENRLSTHDMGIAQALQLGSALNDLPDNIILYGIEIDLIVFESTLSHPVEQAIEHVAIQLKDEIIRTYPC